MMCKIYSAVLPLPCDCGLAIQRVGTAVPNFKFQFYLIYLIFISNETRIVRGSDYSPAMALSEDNDIFRGIYLFEKLMARNNPDVDLVNDSVYTNFGYILCIHSQDIERKRNSHINQGL